MLYHSFSRTSSNCFRDVEGRNLLLMLLFKIVNSDLIIFKSGASQEGTILENREAVSFSKITYISNFKQLKDVVLKE